MISSTAILPYRAAISLNNIGVVLLEQADFRQALEVLKDAIFVMKLVFPSCRSCSSTSNLSNISNEINVKLQCAMERLASPRSPESCPLTLDAISYEDGNIALLKNCLRHGPTSPFVFPIKITCSDFEYPEDRDVDVESAILLYNFGLAHMCIATARANGGNGRKAQERALKLFRLSESILVQQSSSCDQLDEQTNIILVAAMVFSSTVRILMHQGKVREAEEARRKLSLVGDMVNEIEQADALRGINVRAAAAA